MNIVSYDKFIENNNAEGLVAGTIMSIQEKKSAKGTPYAIVKFSDKKREFELFLFSEILTQNREKLKESESFVINLQKDKINSDEKKQRVNVKKILSLEEVINRPYSKIMIEINEKCKFNEIKHILSRNGETEVNIVINCNNKKVYYSLQNNKKINFKDIKALKAKDYVEKIIV